ncbi:unannotated protein [freshwater metagenome]|uniref:Unannotated protein n=1 Tax=freshwater metagenome TaxID=449393 RepID=A0A6J6EHB0_9ZZZZ
MRIKAAVSATDSDSPNDSNQGATSGDKLEAPNPAEMNPANVTPT